MQICAQNPLSSAHWKMRKIWERIYKTLYNGFQGLNHNQNPPHLCRGMSDCRPQYQIHQGTRNTPTPLSRFKIGYSCAPDVLTKKHGFCVLIKVNLCWCIGGCSWVLHLCIRPSPRNRPGLKIWESNDDVGEKGKGWSWWCFIVMMLIMMTKPMTTILMFSNLLVERKSGGTGAMMGTGGVHAQMGAVAVVWGDCLLSCVRACVRIRNYWWNTDVRSITSGTLVDIIALLPIRSQDKAFRAHTEHLETCSKKTSTKTKGNIRTEYIQHPIERNYSDRTVIWTVLVILAW